MFGITRRRTLIRVLSYTVSAFMIAVIFAVSGFVTAYKLRMSVEYSYQRALSELSEHVDNIDIALQKGYYASTSAQLIGLSSQIWSESGAANANLAEMPLTNLNLTNTTKFLSQAGDYANSLAIQLAQNRKITDADRQNIKNLSDRAKSLSAQLSDIESNLQSGRLTLFKSDKVLNTSNIKQASTQSTAGDGLANIEKNMSNIPSFIYDGPFSDNIQQKTPSFTKGKAPVSRSAARSAAAAFLGIAASALKDGSDSDGVLPSYNFSSGTVSISVAKAGGLVVRMLDSRSVGSTKISGDAAQKKAADFLNAHGISSMTQTYSLINNNIDTLNFAYNQGGVICYPDLMKVGIAQDNGAVVSFDATGYIMNHKARTLPPAKISQSSALAMLNPHLTLQHAAVALIPTPGGGESLCYEFKCTGDTKQNIIDYFSTQTGVEEQVLILTTTPGGTLAM